MASKKHLTTLQQGVDVWNKWRQENLKIHPNLSYANLSGANLTEADLHGVVFSGADLIRTNLRKANLSGAAFDGANLRQADLSRAILKYADLSRASLSGANLTGVDLSGASLIESQVLGTNFTAAILTGSCIQDWHINNDTQLAEVDCEYVYLKRSWNDNEGDPFDEGEPFYDDRRPSDPTQNFAPGEFAKLFQKALSTVDLIFRNGVDWVALLISLEKLRIEAEGAELSIQAIESKNDGAFVVRVNVPPETNKAEIERFLKREYDLALNVLDEKYHYQLNAKDVEIASYRRENANLMEMLRLMANRPINVEAKAIAESQAMGDTFNNNFQGANITNFANKLEGNARQQAIVHNFSPEQNLAKVTAEVQQLLDRSL